MMLEIHCADCGEFRIARPKKKLEDCPRCKRKDAIILAVSYDIEQRFKSERETRP